MAEEPYKHFDKDPIVDTTDVVIKGFRFRVRELALGGTIIVCLIVIVALAAVLGSVNTSKNNDGATAGAQGGGGGSGCGDQCFTTPCFKTAAYVTQLLNNSVSPCKDFHTFACGSFPAVNPLMPQDTETTSALLVHNRNWDRLHRLLEQLNTDTNPQGYEYKLRTFFQSCNDHYTKMQQQGKPFIDKIIAPSGGWWALEGDAIWNAHPYDFHKQLRMIHVDFWTDAFFTFGVTTDWLDWNKNVIEVDLSGTGLQYYYYYYPAMYGVELSAYRIFIRTVGSLLIRDSGLTLTEAEKTYRLDTFVKDVFYVENTLASMMAESGSTNDPFNHTSRISLSTINLHANGAVDFVDILSYMFRDAGVTGNTKVIVMAQEYINKTTAWIDHLPPANKSRILNNYMIWRVAHKYAQDLSWDYVHANREVYVTLADNKDFLGTWKYCVNKLDKNMNEALSALFVRNHFSDDNKNSAIEITNYVKRAMVESLSNSMHWMSPDTRKIATQKLEESVFKLGYPDYMMNSAILNQLYSVVRMTPEDYFGNLLSLNQYFRYDWNKRLSRQVDAARQEVWAYATYSYVAEYYNPWRELIVPAGLLQFPVYDHTSPRYMNFGSMGSIVARQLTHAIDQIGNAYRLNGSHYGTWWSNATTSAYAAVKNCTVNAYKNLKNGPYVIPGERNPEYVDVPASYYAPIALGDASGVKLAFKAYQDWISVTGGEKEFPGGLYTNNQLFFINYAQTYCFNRNPQDGYNKANRGTWIQENVRINAALAQVQAFQDAFKCQPTDQMVAPKRCGLY